MIGKYRILVFISLVAVFVTYFYVDSRTTISQASGEPALTFAVVRTMAELRTLPVSSSSGMVTVEGYFRPGDGGGGSFYWDSFSTKNDNGGTVIKPEIISGPGRWVRSDNGPVHPEWFGARKDGTDDTQAVLKALAVGGELVFLEGIYTLSNLDIVKSDQVIRGAGVNRTILDFKNAGPGDGLKISYNNVLGGSKNIYLSDFTVTDSRSLSQCQNLIRIEGGNTGHSPSQTSAFIDLQRITIGKYNNPVGVAMLVRNISSMAIHQFNTAYQMKSANALVVDNDISINTGVISVNSCYLQSMITPLIIKQQQNLLDSFMITNNFIGNFDTPSAREVILFQGVISSVVFEANHIEGRSTVSPVVSASGFLAASTFRGNHFSCGSAQRRAMNLFRFSDLKLRACSFEDNEVLRLSDIGSCFQIDSNCELSPTEPVSIKRFWMNNTKASIFSNSLAPAFAKVIQHD